MRRGKFRTVTSILLPELAYCCLDSELHNRPIWVGGGGGRSTVAGHVLRPNVSLLICLEKWGSVFDEACDTRQHHFLNSQSDLKLMLWWPWSCNTQFYVDWKPALCLLASELGRRRALR